MDGQGTAWECGNGIWIKTEQSRPKWSAVMTGVGFPGGASGKEPACQCRRHETRGFEIWVGMIPWRKARQTTPVFLPGESQGAWWTTVHRVAKSLTWLKQLGAQRTMTVFLPGESHGQRSLAGYSPWGRKGQTGFSNDTTSTSTTQWQV